MISEEGNFVELYDEYYLCTPHEQFIRTHLPEKEEDSFFQLVENKLSLEQFKNLALTNKAFFDMGFTSIKGDKYIQEICGEGKIILKYNTQIRPILSNKVIKDNEEVDYFFMNNRINNGYEIYFYVNEGGYYIFNINAKTDKQKTIYERIASLKFVCQTPPTQKKYYPKFFPVYENEDDIELINPIYNYLQKGSKYDFQIKLSDYDDLFYIIVDKENIIMDKDGDIFSANDVYIHGSEVGFNYCETNGGRTICNCFVYYKTVGDDVEYPKSEFLTLKIRLVSPLKAKLNKGESYEFKIICNTEQVFYLVYLNNNGHLVPLVSLIRNGTTYSTNYTISNSITGSIYLIHTDEAENVFLDYEYELI